MGKKQNNRSKRSLGSLPKGLVHRKGGSTPDPGNPFEMTARMKRPKHLVHNRPVSKPKNTKHALENLQRRQTQLRSSLKSSKKSNVIVDRRIGQYDPAMSQEDQMMARLVKERTRQSQKTSKFRLDEGDDDGDDGFVLTHKGKRLDPNRSEAIYSDDEDDYGNLEAVDTELHFGGSGLSSGQVDPYGGSAKAELADVYGQRKTELDDLIARRKFMKAEKMQAKETQAETVEKMDDDFAELAQLLHYRKDQKRPLIPPTPTQEEKEMNEWNMEIRQMMMKPKKKATDRTKTPEEIAKEESEKLHDLETRRLARMNGDFEEDDFSDISVDDHKKNRRKKRAKREMRNPDELSDSDNESDDEDKLEAVFTADGLKYVDNDGRVVEKSEGSEDENDHDVDDSSDVDINENNGHHLKEGTRVQGNYRAAEQFGGHESWYDGVVSKVHKLSDGRVKYDVDYDDGDFEENMIPDKVRPLEKSVEEKEKAKEMKNAELELKMKRNKARDKAR